MRIGSPTSYAGVLRPLVSLSTHTSRSYAGTGLTTIERGLMTTVWASAAPTSARKSAASMDRTDVRRAMDRSMWAPFLASR